MKLLLDENLSRRLVPVLEPLYPGTIHVSAVGLERGGARVLLLGRHHRDGSGMAMAPVDSIPPCGGICRSVGQKSTDWTSRNYVRASHVTTIANNFNGLTGSYSLHIAGLISREY